jgi:cyclic-di-GMP phosphodiesterase TipF (flagellum assembly factor)
MRKAMTVLLSGGYLFFALALAALFWRAEAGWGAGAAVLIGALGLAFSVHNMIARGSSLSDLRKELVSLRDAHGLLTDQLEETQAAIEILSDSLHRETEAKAKALTGEVRLLEDLVAKLGETLDSELAAAQTRARAAAYAPSYAPRDHQATLLMHTLREALSENRIDLYLQPIVNLPQRRTLYYESYTRLRDESGRVMMPAEYLNAAETGGMISAIDNMQLLRCVQVVRRLSKAERKVGIFCNVSLAGLGDETVFPQVFEFLTRHKDLAGSLIFELGQESFEMRGAVETRNMARLAGLGLRFSIDKVTALDFDFSDLARSQVKFVKVSADVLLTQLLDDRARSMAPALKDLHHADYAALTRRHGIKQIAEKIEHERQVVDILDLEVGLGQGRLFGEPRAIRDSVLAEPTPAPTAAPPKAPPAEPVIRAPNWRRVSR